MPWELFLPQTYDLDRLEGTLDAERFGMLKLIRLLKLSRCGTTARTRNRM